MSTKIECAICGNVWTKHQYEAEMVDWFNRLLTDADSGWCPSCGDMGAAYEVGSQEWRESTAYHESCRAAAWAEFNAAGRPNKTYLQHLDDARNLKHEERLELARRAR